MIVNDYVVFDLETTGLDPKKNKIIEIGAARIRGGRIESTFQTFVNPGVLLEERIVELTGITQEELDKAPYIETIIDEFLAFIGDDVLLGHNLQFDYSFLKRAVVQCSQDKNCKFEKLGLDTLHIARKYLSELPSRSLPELCKYYEIGHLPHRALDDAIATHEVYQKLVRAFSTDNRIWENIGNYNVEAVGRCDGNIITEADINEKSVDGISVNNGNQIEHRVEIKKRKDKENKFEPRKLFYHVKKEGPITKAQQERLYQMLEIHKIVPEYDVTRLTKNEASREIDRIILKYGKI